MIRCNPSAPCVSGWKFDAVFSRSGAFPTECVHPIAAPDFLSLPLDRKAEPRGGAGQVAVSSAVAVAVASTMAAHEIDQTVEVHKHTRAHLFSVSAPFDRHNVLFDQSLIFRGFPWMALLMEMWMRGCCRTASTTCWSSPRSTSDRELKGKGETRRENGHTQ